jgi:glycerol-3-phosphate dehydrogenase
MIRSDVSEWVKSLRSQPLDLLVVGGGATGLGVAVQAALEGRRVALVEARDYASGTSSRSTKLLHGGVRYLAQGRVRLVREALRERAVVLGLAPHLAQPLPFVVAEKSWLSWAMTTVGLTLYQWLAGGLSLGPTRALGAAAMQRLLPGLPGVVAGVRYWDGQFDDARLALALARTAASLGALVVNYCPATALVHDHGKVAGFVCRDAVGGQEFTVRARAVVNATGVWVDGLRQMDGEATGRPVTAMVAPSQGVHIVVDREFLPSDHALMVPKTADGRVLFAVPWLGKLILGTTDSPRQDVVREPLPFAEEVRFILEESARYLSRAPGVQDIRSIWVGLRPLVKPQDDDGDNTKSLSREHTVLASRSGLVTVTGGKWTTYRAMAEDVLQKCFTSGLLPEKPAGITNSLPVVGSPRGAVTHRISDAQGMHSYGSDAAFVQALAGQSVELGAGLTEAMVRFAARYEYACTVEDVLARRSRMLFLDARKAIELAPAVAAILHEELGTDPALEDFLALAPQYLHVPA